MASPWSRDEVELIVADYFAMFEAELRGDDVNKADHNRRLRTRLNNRSKGSVEFKHANISAVLLTVRSHRGLTCSTRKRLHGLSEAVITKCVSYSFALSGCDSSQTTPRGAAGQSDGGSPGSSQLGIQV
jgi:hypothetical protein